MQVAGTYGQTRIFYIHGITLHNSFSQQISTENLLCAGHLDSVGLAVNKINSNSSHRFDSLLSLPTKKCLRATHFI